MAVSDAPKSAQLGDTCSFFTKCGNSEVFSDTEFHRQLHVATAGGKGAELPLKNNLSQRDAPQADGYRMQSFGGACGKAIFQEKLLSAAPDKVGTTLMVRNIACRLKPQEVHAEFQALGFGGQYDYLYVPMNSKGKANLGYFFINFVSAEAALRAMVLLHNTTFGRVDSTKLCQVSFSQTQGVAAQVEAREQYQEPVSELLATQVDEQEPFEGKQDHKAALRKAVMPAVIKTATELPSMATDALQPNRNVQDAVDCEICPWCRHGEHVKLGAVKNCGRAPPGLGPAHDDRCPVRLGSAICL